MARPLDLGQRTETEQDFESIQPSATRAEAVGAAFELANFETVTNSLMRLLDDGDEEDDNTQLIEPQILNKEVPDLPVPVAEPMTRRAFNRIKKNHEKRVLAQRKIALGPQDYMTTGMSFGAALLAHATDPLEIGAGLVTGGAFTIAKGVKMGLRSGSILRGLEKASKLRALESKVPLRALRQDIVEGVVGNVAVEPIVALAARGDNADYDAWDSAQGVALGTIGFAGVKYGIHRGFEAFRNYRGRQSEMLDETQRARFVSDKKINADEMEAQFLRETESRPIRDSRPMGSTEPVNRDYTYVEKSEANLRGTDMYAVSHRGTGDLELENITKLEDDFGPTINFTDNPNHANGAAARGSSSNAPGRIIRVRPEEQNLIDLETRLPNDVINIINRAMGPAGVKRLFSKLDFEAKGRRVIDGIKEGITRGMVDEQVLDRIAEELSKAGFDGYKFKGGQALGKSQPNYNGMALFNTKKVKQVDSFNPDMASQVLPDTNRVREMANESASERSNVDFDETLEPRTKELLERGDPQVDENQLKAFESEALEEMQIRRDLGQVSKEFADDIKADQAKAEKLEEIEKAAFVCVERNG